MATDESTVERRRRDNINEQIQELSVLVTELGASQSPRTETILNGPPNATKPNKGAVLRKSVEYIRLLKSIVQEKNERERLLGKDTKGVSWGKRKHTDRRRRVCLSLCSPQRACTAKEADLVSP